MCECTEATPLSLSRANRNSVCKKIQGKADILYCKHCVAKSAMMSVAAQRITNNHYDKSRRSHLCADQLEGHKRHMWPYLKVRVAPSSAFSYQRHHLILKTLPLQQHQPFDLASLLELNHIIWGFCI